MLTLTDNRETGVTVKNALILSIMYNICNLRDIEVEMGEWVSEWVSEWTIFQLYFGENKLAIYDDSMAFPPINIQNLIFILWRMNKCSCN
jgi:hypothetical protein